MLPIVLDAPSGAEFEQRVVDVDGRQPFEVDLVRNAIVCPDGKVFSFAIDPGERTALLEGLDDVAMTMRHRSRIEAWEKEAATRQPWLQRIVS